ncbi:DNA-binding protein [Curtobacterium sp. MCBD17_003]|uniref:DNA-binding protein n=1 Tax=Curtobacterium sp. MCBD17_003 TaxID=2175667 RepID=UPI000DA86537|nr:DNA-binding protein [Curtobacterium sp. MCBD17_003]WIE56060.1 DNA-binding protein [Curtobacterium sp. MCBD17_003]
MYVITADQIDSRHGADLVEAALAAIRAAVGPRLLLPADRTAGDELQIATADAGAALDVVFRLARAGDWSIGCGIGDVQTPLPTATRAASGTAFYRAREAVERAKDRPDHVAVAVEPGRHRTADDVEPLVTQAIRLRARRSPEGWELADLLDQGMSQREAARHLGISPQAASKRAAAAGLREDDAVRAALVRLLEDADRPGPDGAPA